MRFNASTDYRGAAWLHAGLLFTFMFLFAPSESQAQVPTRPVRPLRVAYLSTSATMAPVWMAKETGAIRQGRIGHGSSFLVLQQLYPALLANEIDVVEVSAAPIITASLRGIDVVFIAGLLNTMIWDFYARPEIKNVEQLKGKIIGTDRPATPVAYGTLVALKKMGLTPKDVQLRPLAAVRKSSRRFMRGKSPAASARRPPALNWSVMDFIHL